ncbi:hypothetical protein GOP47_0012488 [Adiantum capillus-veneris]|uniref:YqgF/RNase H-like domain-containing protein n=1 Tax=Adiantum capillus-veneris TaxID=13818 RepID=A0A9D4ZFR3_ADICA|nr:hypothetical protein GOP47_0012488 [Adiantum capillus-veneris]
MKLASLHGLQTAVHGSKRLLGLDVGVKYVGVAVSDPACRIAIPLDVLQLSQSTFSKSAEKLKSMAKDYNVAGFVIGYPISIAGLRCKQAVKVDNFVAIMRKTEKFEGLLYFWEDERFTSQVVSSMLKDYEIPRHILKPIVDKFSAVNILQIENDVFFLKVFLKVLT